MSEVDALRDRAEFAAFIHQALREHTLALAGVLEDLAPKIGRTMPADVALRLAARALRRGVEIEAEP